MKRSLALALSIYCPLVRGAEKSKTDVFEQLSLLLEENAQEAQSLLQANETRSLLQQKQQLQAEAAAAPKIEEHDKPADTQLQATQAALVKSQLQAEAAAAKVKEHDKAADAPLSLSGSETTAAPSFTGSIQNPKLTICLAAGASVLLIVVCCVFAHSAMRQKRPNEDVLHEFNIEHAWAVDDEGRKHEAWIKDPQHTTLSGGSPAASPRPTQKNLDGA